MTRTGHHNILIALLLLVFISQSIAALMMSCQHSANTEGSMAKMHHDMAAMEGMDPSLHSDHSTPAPSPQKADCCKAFGHCSAGGCSLAMVSETVIFFTTLHSSISDLYSSTLPIALATSLFRPPIFR